MLGKIIEIPFIIDDKIERYFGEYLVSKDDHDQEEQFMENEVEKFGQGMTISRYGEVHEGWYENGE